MLVGKICCRTFVMSEGDTQTTNKLTKRKKIGNMEKVLTTALAIIGHIFLTLIGFSVLIGVLVAFASI